MVQEFENSAFDAYEKQDFRKVPTSCIGCIFQIHVAIIIIIITVLISMNNYYRSKGSVLLLA